MDQAAQIAPSSTQSRPHPWEKHYPEGIDWGVKIEPVVVPALLDRSAAQWGDKTLIEYRDRTLSFTQLAAYVDRMAAGLIKAGIGRGRTVALFLPNTPWHSVCFFAALKAGARLVHMSPLDAPRELAHKVMDSGADVVITTDLAGLGVGASKFVELGLVKLLLVGEDAFWGGPQAPVPAYDGEKIRRLEEFFDDDIPAVWPEIDVEDIALLQYTGGTTGMPKGAMLSHRNLTAATGIYRTWRDKGLPGPGESKVIAVLPMFHVYALGVILLLGVGDGSEILLRPRFDIPTTLRDIEEKRANSFPAVPTMLIAMLSEPGIETRDLSSLRVVGSGGAPMPHEVGQRVEALFKVRLGGGWGMTETAAAGSRIPPGAAQKPGLIGVPLPNIELRVVSLDDPHVTLGAAQVGELAVRGPNVFSGYWNQDALNKTSFVDGFFLTGDIGKMDVDGLFYILDRKKRMIISGGFNVYPNMIETAIYEHPDVEEVVVIGIPDEYRGEAAKAFIKLKAGADPITLEGLRAFLRERVGKHELPAAIELRADLPKSPVGKLLANVLEQEERDRAKA